MNIVSVCYVSSFIIISQVIQGGNYDVDVKLISPGHGVLYQEQRKQYDSHEFTTQVAGEFYFCFSNEFSSFSHKMIYFDFIVGEEPPLTADAGAHHTALTQLETSAVSIHESLKLVSDYQTHHRLREAIGRDQAEKMNERVLYWSLAEAIALVVVAVGQVLILRRFFAEKRTTI